MAKTNRFLLAISILLGLLVWRFVWLEAMPEMGTFSMVCAWAVLIMGTIGVVLAFLAAVLTEERP